MYFELFQVGLAGRDEPGEWVEVVFPVLHPRLTIGCITSHVDLDNGEMAWVSAFELRAEVPYVIDVERYHTYMYQVQTWSCRWYMFVWKGC